MPKTPATLPGVHTRKQRTKQQIKKEKAYNKEEINRQTTDKREEKAYNKEEINTKTTDDKNRKKKDK